MLHARINLLWSLSLTRRGRAAESMAELAEIVAAIAANDADAAAKVCGRHVEAPGMAAFQRPHPGSGREVRTPELRFHGQRAVALIV